MTSTAKDTTRRKRGTSGEKGEKVDQGKGRKFPHRKGREPRYPRRKAPGQKGREAKSCSIVIGFHAAICASGLALTGR
jgi:hypothetical protein